MPLRPRQTSSKGRLYLVATPLGNLEDISGRAARCLREADAIYAEDTRRSSILMQHLGLKRRLRSLHEHNERQRVHEVLGLLGQGQGVVLLTDAGTPGVSDPGSVVVRAAAEAQHGVTPIPGPSALTAALSVAGFPAAGSEVLFVGFLPTKGRERQRLLERVAAQQGLVVMFEGPHRLHKTLQELARLDRDRPMCLCRELTKIHEEVRHATVGELVDWAAGDVKGELTLVLGPGRTSAKTPEETELRAALARCLDAGLSRRDAAVAVAVVCRVSKRRVYQMLGPSSDNAS